VDSISFPHKMTNSALLDSGKYSHTTDEASGVHEYFKFIKKE